MKLCKFELEKNPGFCTHTCPSRQGKQAAMAQFHKTYNPKILLSTEKPCLDETGHQQTSSLY